MQPFRERVRELRPAFRPTVEPHALLQRVWGNGQCPNRIQCALRAAADAVRSRTTFGPGVAFWNVELTYTRTTVQSSFTCDEETRQDRDDAHFLTD
jgi:hypothetical protein